MSQPTANAISAHQELLAIAAWGQQFTYDDVFINRAEPEAAFGHGFDFQTALQVPDHPETGTVDATMHLRLIGTIDDRLFVRARLIWTPTSGEGEHRSYACYQLSAEDAERLANTPPDIDIEEPISDDITPEEAAEILAEHFTAYNAEWEQSYNDNDAGLIGLAAAFGRVEPENPESNTELSEYHARVIHTLSEAGHDVTCMLSDADYGSIDPDELGRLLRWIKTQPEITDIT
jgi:hypothetical protein